MPTARRPSPAQHGHRSPARPQEGHTLSSAHRWRSGRRVLYQPRTPPHSSNSSNSSRSFPPAFHEEVHAQGARPWLFSWDCSTERGKGKPGPPSLAVARGAHPDAHAHAQQHQSARIWTALVSPPMLSPWTNRYPHARARAAGGSAGHHLNLSTRNRVMMMHRGGAEPTATAAGRLRTWSLARFRRFLRTLRSPRCCSMDAPPQGIRPCPHPPNPTSTKRT